MLAALAAALTVTTADARPRNVCARHPACLTRVTHRWQNERRRAAIAPYRPWLARVRACESGGDYAINTGNGFYGAYQFTLQTWRGVGGRGMPHKAGRLEQDFRAVRLLHVQGRGAWPVCGRR